MGSSSTLHGNSKVLTLRRPEVNLRKDERFATYLPVHILWRGLRVEAIVLDLSRGGALIHCHGRHELADMVWFSMLGKENAARVRWVRGDRAGVEFVNPLSVRELIEALAAAR